MSPLSTGRCALYHRGSRLDPDPQAALRDLRATAERLGLRVVLRIEETGSGALNDRPVSCGFWRPLGTATWTR